MSIPRPVRAAAAATVICLALTSCGDDDGSDITDTGDVPADPGGSPPEPIPEDDSGE